MKKKRLAWMLPSCLMAGLLAGVQAMPVLAAEEDDSLIGQMAFAQCEEYINIRDEASTDGQVTAKIYNNDSAIIEEEAGDWYKITSGNAEGYVKAEYFVTGEAADAIAEQVAYHVAKVYPNELNIRANPDEGSGVIASAGKDQELEVVAWDGDWMKVALSADEFGYVNAYYVDYKTYYPVAETLEEEQARLQAEQNAAQDGSGNEETAYPAETVTEETEYVPETSVTEETEYVPETSVTEETEYVPETSASEETEYVPETSAPEETEYVPETEAAEETEYVPETEATEETEYVPETEATEETEYVPETSAPEETEYVPETSAPEETEYVPETEASSGLGQQIADYAVQFVGNPYAWGGTSLTDGADCSGFTMSVFANFGIGLVHYAESQAYGGTSVSLDSLQPGDLVFYSSGGGIDHVAIYIGGGQIVHAANSSSGIIISSAYYSTPVCAARYW